MPVVLKRMLVALLAAPLLLLASCGDEPTGTMRVTVIGGPPTLVDPINGPLSPPDAVLAQNVAQGLVSFDASGDIVDGLAERWNVSDDGLSYIFRLSAGEWPGGGKITAEQVARTLRRQLQSRSRNGVKDGLGAVSEIVAMTDRVIEIRLVAPRPNLLPLLAQPDMGVVRNGVGTGPFTFSPDDDDKSVVALLRTYEDADENIVRERLLLEGRAPEKAIAAFLAGETDLVLGGTYADLPLARRGAKPRSALRFDEVSGLFGLMPAKAGGRFDTPEWRALLSQAIDRDALVAALGVPGLAPRTTVLQAGLDGVSPVAPPWAAVPLADRQEALASRARALLGDPENPVVKVAIPASAGADLIIRQLGLDWGIFGLRVERVDKPADADFLFIDEVAPSTSPAWFVRHFRCPVAKVCDAALDELLAAAREAPVPDQRYALLTQAAAIVEDQTLFMPITAPIRWSLVGSRVKNFAGNRYARHTLIALGAEPSAQE